MRNILLFLILITLTGDVQGASSRFFTQSSSEYLLLSSAKVTGYPFTVSLWFKTNDDASLQTLYGLGDSSTNTGFHRLAAAGNAAGDPLRMQLEDNPGTGTITLDSSNGWFSNQWSHAASVELNASDHSIFLDGVETPNTTTKAFHSGVDQTSIGALVRLTQQQYMDGEIAQFAIWNQALSNSEIKELSEGQAPYKIRPESLICYLPLFSVGVNATDISNQNDGDFLDNNGTTSSEDGPPVWL